MVKSIKLTRPECSLLRMSVTVCAVVFSLAGCGQDYSLNPPADSEKITVTVKVPRELKTETMWAMYRSTKCKRVSHGASGQRTERDGHHSIYQEFERQGQSEFYKVELSKDGGGDCKWHLANVTFDVVYAEPTEFGEKVVKGAGGGVVVIFDNNNSPHGPANIKVEGDLLIRKDYYPWLKESFLLGYSKRVGLVGEGDIYLIYQASQARKVYFEPVFHPGFLISSIGPKVHKDGVYTAYTYPDGMVVADDKVHPDFQKLQSIRLAAETEKWKSRRME